MTYSALRRLQAGDSTVERLTQVQFVHPHQPLRAALGSIGIEAETIRAVLERLHLDGQRAIGRLRRTELIQLARSLERAGRPVPAQPVH